MEHQSERRVLSADRLDGSVVITFDDGRCALYSPELLYATLSQAKELSPTVEGANFEPQTPQQPLSSSDDIG